MLDRRCDDVFALNRRHQIDAGQGSGPERWIRVFHPDTRDANPMGLIRERSAVDISDIHGSLTDGYLFVPHAHR